MIYKRSFAQWYPPVDLPDTVTPDFARDQMVLCFMAAHGSQFLKMKAKLGVEPTKESLERTVKGMLRIAFTDTGGSFDAPTRETLFAAAERLRDKSDGWGTPPDVVERHLALMGQIIERVIS